ncbi:hypothetical protein J7W08_07550 [Methanococcoides orientis]|uniref:hypothetical protein n=1 Tax=Methanococcoides orientis TaxID=2822137 RepID=UPI001E620770|nr:hypothetical protein [Methanococcoides orientis]UGV39972.1 hypothetical protein J7W08_07550 [Methanococcoides orientis]
MHTVYIKAVKDENIFTPCNVNVDAIKYIHCIENKVFLSLNPEDVGAMICIYAGKAINGEEQVDNIVSLIASAKVNSEKHGMPILLDFSEQIDRPKATMMRGPVVIVH